MSMFLISVSFLSAISASGKYVQKCKNNNTFGRSERNDSHNSDLRIDQLLSMVTHFYSLPSCVSLSFNFQLTPLLITHAFVWKLYSQLSIST